MHDVIIRNYSVILKPDANTEFDPVKVTLSFTVDDARRVARDSAEAHREAFALAVKREREENITPPERAFLSGGIRCLRERLVQSETPAYNRMKRAIAASAGARVARKQR